jgi:hypothetical protein
VNNTLTELDAGGNGIGKSGRGALGASARLGCTVRF